MTIKKIFLSVYDEKKWLDKMMGEGYVLSRRQGLDYIFEKSETPVFYRYIFLKNGRKSFLALDHKNRDPKCRLIYGNGFVALFCRKDAYPELLTKQELKFNYLKHRQGRQTAAICYIAACCAFIMGARTLSPLWLASAAFAVLGVLYMLDIKKIDKLIKEEL